MLDWYGLIFLVAFLQNDTIYNCNFLLIRCKDMLAIKLDRNRREEAENIW